MWAAAHTAAARKAILPHQGCYVDSLIEPVFLRPSRAFRVICLQDHSVFWQEAALVCEQSPCRWFQPHGQTISTRVSRGLKSQFGHLCPSPSAISNRDLLKGLRPTHG